MADRPANQESAMARQSDPLTPEQRSRNMAKVRGANTGPEMRVRKALHEAGFRYRLHRSSLPGKPDLVLPRYRTAVFVHGCFWHGHHCPRGKRPSSNSAFWDKKLDRNIERDQMAQKMLTNLGWTVVVLWECSLESEVRALLISLDAARSSLLGRMQSNGPASEVQRSQPSAR